MSKAQTPSTPQYRDKTEVDITELGLPSDEEFSAEIPSYGHSNAITIHNLIEGYNEDPERDVTIGKSEEKALAAYEVLKKSLSILIEIEPWYVKQKMGTENYSRWEPFVLGFPEWTENGQLVATNLAPLSEVWYYLVKRRDSVIEKFNDGKTTSEGELPYPTKAIIAKYKALTRYQLKSSFNGENDPDAKRNRADDDRILAAWIDKSPIKAIHTYNNSWPNHLIVGRDDDNGQLYCGRSTLFDEHVDIAIDVSRYEHQGEHKVALYNDKSNKDPIMNLPFNKTHRKYLGAKRRWEIDMAGVGEAMRELLRHDDIDYVSINRATEEMYQALIEPGFGKHIEGHDQQLNSQ